MSKLSLIPKGVVIAMQAALVSLVLLAIVPIASGGLEVNIESGPDIDYDDHFLRISLVGNADADIYFNITDFRYDIIITSGGQVMNVFESDSMTISRKGVTPIDMDASVPLTSVLMMLLLCVDESDMILTVNTSASTLGGMISLSASADTVFAGDIASTGSMTVEDNELRIPFSIPVSELTGKIFAEDVVISIGDTTIYVDCDDNGVLSLIDVRIVSSGGSVMDDIENAYSVSYDGSAPETLTAEQKGLITGTLAILYERWGA